MNTLDLRLLSAVLSLSLLACDVPSVGPAPGGRVAVSVAPLGMADLSDARYVLTVYSGPAGAGVVVSERELSLARDGDALGGLTVMAPCDASTGTNTVVLTLVALYRGRKVVAADTYVSPPALSREVACLPDEDAAAHFALTVAHCAEDGTVDGAVAFGEVTCSARLDCLRPVTGGDLELLHNPADGGRQDLTALLELTCAGRSGAAAQLYLDDPVVRCEGLASEVVVDACSGGDVDLAAPPSSDGDGYLFAASVNRVAEPQGQAVHWTVAFGLNEARFATAGRCRLSGRGSAATTPFARSDRGWEPPADTVYPMISWELELSDGDGRVCTQHELMGADDAVTVEYVGLAVEGGHAAPRWDAVALRHRFTPETGAVESAPAPD